MRCTCLLACLVACRALSSAQQLQREGFRPIDSVLNFSASGGYAAARQCLTTSSLETKESNEWLTLNRFLGDSLAFLIRGASTSTLTIQVSDWSSSLAVTALAEIILREKLGYNVQLFFAPPSVEAAGKEINAATYHYLFGHLDMNFELWPALKQFERSATLAQLCNHQGTSIPCVYLYGTLGYTAHSGWFVSNATLPGDVHVLAQASGFGGFTVPVDPAADGSTATIFEVLSRGLFQDLDMLSSNFATNLFVTSDMLPAEIVYTSEFCAFQHSEKDPRSSSALRGGRFDCEAATWTSNVAACCTRERALAGDCTVDEKRCIALIVWDPSYDVGWNEHMVTSLGASHLIQIVYANVRRAVAFGRELNRPLIVSMWEPNRDMRNMTTAASSEPLGPFVRMSTTPHAYCENTLGYSADAKKTDAVTIGSGSAACDFPFQHVEKAANKRMLYLRDVNRLMQTFSLSYEQVMELLMKSDYFDPSSFWTAACDFLKENEAYIDEHWVLLNPEPLPVTAVLIALAFIFAYYLREYIMLMARVIMLMIVRMLGHIRVGRQHEAATNVDLGLARSVASRTIMEAPSTRRDPALRKPLHALSESVALRVVTFARREITVTEDSQYVLIPVIQAGGDAGEVELELSTADGLAKRHRQYGAIAAIQFDQAGAVLRPDASSTDNTCTLLLSGRHANAMVLIPIFRDFQHSITRSFTVRIHAPPDVHVHFSECVVHIMNTDHFPCGQYFKEERSWRMVFHFLVASHRGRVSVALKHQLGRALSAVITGILALIFKSWMIDSFSAYVSLNLSVFSAVMMLNLRLVDEQLDFWFSPVDEVTTWLQRMLARKYLALADEDMTKMPGGTAAAFRDAIRSEAAGVSSACVGAFHRFLGGVWGVLAFLTYLWGSGNGSFSYLGTAGGDVEFIQGTGITVNGLFGIGILAFAVKFIFIGWLRTRILIPLLDKSVDDKFQLTKQISYTINARKLIRSNAREENATIKMLEAFDVSSASQYAVQLNQYFTCFYATFPITIIIYLLWALAPLAVDVVGSAQFLILLDLLIYGAGSLYAIVDAAINAYASGPEIKKLAALLNLPVQEEELAKQALRDELKLHPRTLSPSPPPSSRASRRHMLPAAPALFEHVRGQPFEKLMSADTLGEAELLRTIFAKRMDVAFEIRAVVYCPVASTHAIPNDGDASHANLFHNLQVAEGEGINQAMLPSHCLPASGLVRLHLCEPPGATDNRTATSAATSRFKERAELALMMMLKGSLKPTRGVVGCIGANDVELVSNQTSQQMLAEEALFTNLLFATAPDDAIAAALTLLEAAEKGTPYEPSQWPLDPAHGPLPTEQQLWTLCHTIGVSASIIGAEYAIGWSLVELSHVVAWSSVEDLTKLCLARALLRRPAALLLYRVADSWTIEQQESFVRLLRRHVTDEWMPWEKGTTSDATVDARSFTVLCCTKDDGLRRLLEAECDYELGLESPSRATLRRSRGASRSVSPTQVRLTA